jgi:hypothetical protein
MLTVIQAYSLKRESFRTWIDMLVGGEVRGDAKVISEAMAGVRFREFGDFVGFSRISVGFSLEFRGVSVRLGSYRSVAATADREPTEEGFEEEGE